MIRKTSWSVQGGRVLGPAPFFVVGIMNVTPDSFYDGGRYQDGEDAVRRCLELREQGADIIDVGGESSRPFAEPLPLEDELQRVLPVIDSVLRKAPDIVLSVDTYKAETAKKALEAGALIINDISACRYDEGLLDVLAHYKPGYVLMHSLGRPATMQTDPKYKDVVGDVRAFFEKHLNRLTGAGLPEENIVLDPGIGFGKLLEHNLDLLKGVEHFYSLGRPVYIGLSNKSLWSKLLDLAIDQRRDATLAATVLLASRGVPIHRVHEVGPTRQALKVVEALTE